MKPRKRARWLFIVTGIANIACLAWGYWRIRGVLRDKAVVIENARRKSDLFSTTLASIGDCVIVTDAAGRITFMNSVAEEVTGWTAAEAQNCLVREIFRIINEETRKAAEDPVEKVIRAGVIVALANHTLLIRKDETELPIDDSGAPIRNSKGDIAGVVLVFRDFSKYRQAEDESRQAKELAESANQAKDNFLAMVSHELRTPLSPVLTTLHHWETSGDASPEIKADIEMLRRNIEREARIRSMTCLISRASPAVRWRFHSFPPIHIFDIPQLSAPGRAEAAPHAAVICLSRRLGQPVGTYARPEQGAIVPTRTGAQREVVAFESRMSIERRRFCRGTRARAAACFRLWKCSPGL